MIVIIFWPKYFKDVVRNFVKWKLIIMFRFSMFFFFVFFSILTDQIQWNLIGIVEVNIHANRDRALSDTWLLIWKMNILIHFHWSKSYFSWWRHQMETFSALLVLCAGNSPVTGEFPSQRPVMRSFDVFFDLRLNNRAAGELRRHRVHYDATVMLTAELTAEPQRKATTATTPQYEVQRIPTNKNELGRIRTISKRLTARVSRWLWFAVAPQQFCR